MPDARATEVAAMILAGGEGKRLHPLTRDRAKPAVPFAGRYRIIDFVLSNFVNSGIFKISVLTQYKSGSLMQHLARGWQLAPQMGHYVAPVPATMNLGPQWFRGSADAAGRRQASMGLYVFNADVLVRAVVEDAERADSTHDFGRDLIPRLAERGRVHAYDFSTNTHPNMTEAERGYWRDIGTLDAYYQGSMDLISVSPVFNLYNPAWPILSAYYPSPPAKFVFADREQNRIGSATDSMISEGCIVSGGHVDRSILGPRVRVNSFAQVSDSILFEGVEVGRHARIRRAILDKNVCVAPGATIGYEPAEDRRHFVVSEEGVVVIPKGEQVGSG